MRARLAVVALAAVGGSLSASATAPAAELCRADGRECMRMAVPLDRSGSVPGTVTLQVERHRARNSARPPLFMLAGGPGQSATRAFGVAAIEEILGTELRSRDVVVMDQRGTGDSGVLSCPALQRRPTLTGIAPCATALGPRRAFYSAADMADDIDVVREALGAPRIALYGGSYGTHVALTYARRHPTRVERLVLDAVVGPDGIDAFERPSHRAAPRILRGFCGGGCRSFTRDAGADLTRLAAQLEQRPLTGFVTGTAGRRRPARIDGAGLLDVVVAGDADPFVRAYLPGAVRNALRGDPIPLLRAQMLGNASEGPSASPRQLSEATFVATLCEDVALPWSDDTPMAGRRAAASAFVAALPADAFAPFGPRTALDSDPLAACERWPASSRPAQPAGALPDVPALLLSGSADARTPVENAQAVAALLPQARLMTIANGGHGTLGSDFSPCVPKAFRRFLAGGEPGRCPAGRRLFAPLPPPPLALGELGTAGGVGGRPGRTMRAVQRTIADGLLGVSGELLGRLFAGPGAFQGQGSAIRTGALRGGNYALLLRTSVLRFRRASLVPGVRVSGTFRIRRSGTRALLKVSGPAAADGRLLFRKGVLSGRLGGREVRARFAVGFEFLLGPGASSSRQARPVQARPLFHLR